MDAYDTQVWAVAVVILVALVAAAWLLAREHRRKQSHRLQQRFGPEYARVVAERGNKAQAEAELLERERRVERFKLLALTAEERPSSAMRGPRCRRGSSTTLGARSSKRITWCET